MEPDWVIMLRELGASGTFGISVWGLGFRAQSPKACMGSVVHGQNPV